MEKKKYDISGWVTKFDVKCSDGRTIKKEAFVKDDGKRVPLLWHHMHSDPMNVLGHALLENRPEGVYGYVKFNNTEKAIHAKEMVRNEDVNSFSIFATKLIHSGNDVIHGEIQEVSLVLVGANAEAKIDNASFRHSDGTSSDSDEEVIIQFGDVLEHTGVEEPETETTEVPDVESGEGEGQEDPETVTETEAPEGQETDVAETLAHAGEDPTVGEVYDSFTPIQKDVVNAMLYQVAGGEPVVQHADQQGGNPMGATNLFEQQGANQVPNVLSHADFQSIMQNVQQQKGSLKTAILGHDSVLAHATTYGIENIEYLFPEHKMLTTEPTLYGRDVSWVEKVMTGIHRTPFSRIKSMYADITGEEARALGYTKGNKKKEEVFKLLKRTTSPTTIYKKQKLDRDDIIDIVDINVVAFLKAEMRLMLREETARAILLSDGRAADHEDKIKDPAGSIDGIGIRSIYHDDEFYAFPVRYAKANTPDQFVDSVIRARKNYRGKGQPIMFMGYELMADLLLQKDNNGRRIYETRQSLATVLGVSEIVEIELMDSAERTVVEKIEGVDTDVVYTLDAIMLSMNDYTIGADRGGEVTLFEDFDIDFNQNKYLLETRMSGALKDPKTAAIFERKKV